MTTTKQYDRLNRLKQIQSGMGVSPISSFAYDYNQANQRVKAELEDGSHWDYAYDPLGQVISGKKQRATEASQPDEAFDYQHDDIGNRKEAGGQTSARTSYSANALNQYTQGVDTQAPNKTETLQYDTDGNLIRDGQWTYTWDAENRLIAMESGPGVSTADRKRLEFAYDTQSRRISKKVYAWESNSSNFSLQPSAFSLFVYDGWNLLAELTSDLRPLSSFVWGLDLSGSQQGAGGVGGLLFISDRQVGPSDSHAVAYDGNGNVVALVDTQTGNLSAEYNHGPFGEPTKVTGRMANSNPFRVSTKYTDDESDLVYYGFRYYNPLVGRWLSRDTIAESGGLNTYAFVGNCPVNMIDYHGLTIMSKCLDQYLQANRISQSMYTRSGDEFVANWGVTFSSYGAAQILWNMLQSSLRFTAKNLDVYQLKQHVLARMNTINQLSARNIPEISGAAQNAGLLIAKDVAPGGSNPTLKDWVPGDRGYIQGSGTTGLTRGEWIIYEGGGMFWGFDSPPHQTDLESMMQAVRGFGTGSATETGHRWFPGVGLQ